MEDTIQTSKTIVRFETNEGTSLKALFERLQKFRDCCLEFSPDGIFMNATTSSASMMTILTLNTLDNYYCKSHCSMGIEVSVWFKLFKKITKDDVVVFTIDEDGINATCPYGTIWVYNPTRNILVQYQVFFLNIELEKFDIPAKKFDMICTVPSSELFKILRWCETGGSLVRLYTEESHGKVHLIVETGTVDQTEVESARVRVKVDISSAITSCISKTCKPSRFYNLASILEVARSGSMNSGGSTILYLSCNDYPLVLDYMVGAMGIIKYCIAPIIEEVNNEPSDDIPPMDVDGIEDTIDDTQQIQDDEEPEDKCCDYGDNDE